MRRAAGIPAMLACLGLTLFASSRATAQPFSLSMPAGDSGWGPIVLAVIDQNRARPTGGSYCPPSDDPEEICLDASIVEGSSETVRYLSQRPEGWRDPGRFPRVRFIGGHAVRWVDAGRQLAVLEQTNNGYLWRSWSTSVGSDEICLPSALIDRFRITARIPLSVGADGSRCFRLSALER